MTAVSIFRGTDALHVVSDAAITDADGKLLALTSKVALLPALPAIITTLGHSLLLNALYQFVSHNCPVFEVLIDRMPEFARSSAQHLAPVLAEKGVATTFEILVAGWSDDSECFEIYAMHNRDGQDGAWRMQRQMDPAGVINPLPNADALERAGWDLADWDDFDPERHGLAWIEAQRQTPYDAPGLGPHNIGGFAQFTTVTRDGIASRILRRWPEDRIGQFIQPRAFAQPVVRRSA
jgi:hypothetical protein